MFRGFFLFCFFLFSLAGAFAQVPAGRVLDAVTRQAVSYAYLYFPDLSKGMSCNENGSYPLLDDIPKGKLIVSCLGYESKEIDLAVYSKFPREILLQPSNTTLTEVEVIGLSAKGMLSRAIKHIPDNYPTIEFLASYYYRAQAIDYEKSTPLYAEECIFQQVKKYTKGYQPSLRLLKNRHYNLSDKSVRISGVGLQDYVLNLLSMPVKSNVSYGKRLSNSKQSIIELRLRSDRNEPIGSIYVDSASYAIVKLDISDKKLHHVAEYKPINGKYYLHRLQTTNTQSARLAIKSDVVLDAVRSSFSKDDLRGVLVESWEDMISYVSNPERTTLDSIAWSTHNILLPDSILYERIRKCAQSKPILPKHGAILSLPTLTLSASTFGLQRKAMAEISIGLGSLGSYAVYKAIKNPFICLLAGMLSSQYLQSPIEEALLEQEYLRQFAVPSVAYYLPFTQYQESYLRADPKVLDEFREQKYMDFMQMLTIRNGYHYTKSRLLEEMIMRVDLKDGDNYKKYFNHLLGQLLISKLYNVHFKKRDEIKEHMLKLEYAPISINRENSWVKYLFEPNAKFTQEVLSEDLTFEQRKFLKASSLKSWINLLSPALFSLSQVSIGSHWKAAASLGYLRTPIGEQIEEAFWLRYKENLHNISIKQFLGYSTFGWGIQYKLYDFPLAQDLKLTSHVEGWLQPETFLSKDLFLGGKLGQELVYSIKVNSQKSINISAGYEWKSKGFSYENNRMKPSLDFTLGVAYSL